MSQAPFSTKYKEVRMLVPGDIVVDKKCGARFVTGVSANVNGDFTVRFGPTDQDQTEDNSLTVARFWGTCKVPLVITMTTSRSAEVELLKAQLAARDAALDAVLKLAMERAGPDNQQCFEIVALLERHGVRI